MSSFKKNTLINYLSRGYLGLVGLIVSPVLVYMLGSESFGLIAVFVVIQTWLQLLDLGLSNTLSREAAKYQVGRYKVCEFNKLIQLIKLFYFVMFCILTVFGIVFSETIVSSGWLNIEKIATSDVVLYVKIMVVCISLRWLSVPFRSVLVGLSVHTDLARIDVVMATYRSPICLFILYLLGADLLTYFLIQLSHSFILLCWLYIRSEHHLKLEGMNNSIRVTNQEPVSYRNTIKFTLQMLLTTIVWLMVSQFDKLYLSSTLLLSDYGMLTMGIQLASIIMLLSSPFSVALLPKLVCLKESNAKYEYSNTYINSFHFLMSILIPVCCVVFFFSYEILLLWTKSAIISNYGDDVVKLYVVGNLLLAVGAFAYYILFSYGNLKPHVYMSIVSGVIIIPAYVLSIDHYGALGSALTWVIYNAFLVAFWVPYVQMKFSMLNVTKRFYISLIKITFVSVTVVVIMRVIGVGLENMALLVFLFFTFAIALTGSLMTNTSFMIYGKKMLSKISIAT